MLAGEIAPDDPRAEDVRALLATHLAFNRSQSPLEDCHTLDVDGLAADDVRFFSYRVDGELVAIGALKVIDEDHLELKSMHTVAAARGRGIGRAMVDHLVGVARARGAMPREPGDRVDGAGLHAGPRPSTPGPGSVECACPRRLPRQPQQHLLMTLLLDPGRSIDR